MRYELKYLPAAKRDIASLAEILSPHKQLGARFFRELEQKLELLRDNPLMCPVFHTKPKYRCMNLKNHVLLYTEDEQQQEIQVFRIVYAKRDIEGLVR